jgi:hypothetical protein
MPFKKKEIFWVHSSYPSFSYPEIHLSQRHESQRQLSQFLYFLTVVPAGGPCQELFFIKLIWNIILNLNLRCQFFNINHRIALKTVLPGMYLHRIWTNRAMCQIQICHFICHYGRGKIGRLNKQCGFTSTISIESCGDLA